MGGMMVWLVFMGPPLLIVMWAQFRVRSTYSQAMRVPVNLSGAAAARYLLDAAGLQHVGIEQIGGHLSDHYDPSHKVLRLSQDVYHGHTAASVGIAAHEAGHALQDAERYAPLVLRNFAVPAASFGGAASGFLVLLGVLFQSMGMLMLGVVAMGAVLIFQLINLPVEFDASARAKRLLGEMGIVDGPGGAAVSSVLNAAAWTYVAAVIQLLAQIAYYLFIIAASGGSDD